MDLHKYIKQFSPLCDFVSLRLVNQDKRFIDARNGKAEAASLMATNGIMVEVLYNNQFAYAATNILNDESIKECFNRAKKLAILSADKKIATFDVSMRGHKKGRYKSNTVEPLDCASIAQIQSRLIESTKELKVSDLILDTQAYAVYAKTSQSIFNSSGLEIEQQFDQITFDLKATAFDSGESQTRTLGMMNAQAGWEKINKDFLFQESERIGQQAVELLYAEDCPTGEMDLILAPDQLYLQVHESIGHPLEIDRIIGDERNYAGWSFVSPEDFGSMQYGSHLLNVTFDPHHEGELASYNFDDLGIEAKKEYLIKEGVLLRGIGSVEGQQRSKIPGVSSSRATSWNRPPIDRMANINIEPGNSSLEQMISNTENGIMMHTNKSWSIDDYRNKFQFGCEYAKLIENGKVTKTVKNPNYRGVSTPFWNSLKMVGDESTFKVWGSFYCGKGEPNQIIKVGHAIPICLFENIEIFGGHK